MFGLAAICGSPNAQTTPALGRPTASVVPNGSATAQPSTPDLSVTDPEPTSAPDRRTHLPKSNSQSDPMLLGGHAYVDARPAEGKILGFIGGQQCGDGQSTSLPGDDVLFVVRIASDFEQPGCGKRGVAVTFTINGRAADQTIPWQPGFQEDDAALSAGFKVAIYVGSVQIGAGEPPPMRVVPFVDGVECGAGVSPAFSAQNHARWVFRITVDPAEVRAGCGADGANVTIRLQVEGRPDIELTTIPWEGASVQLSNVDLRAKAITKPSAGQQTQ